MVPDKRAKKRAILVIPALLCPLEKTAMLRRVVLKVSHAGIKTGSIPIDDAVVCDYWLFRDTAVK